MSASVTILWLRRDLRLADHPALIAAAEHAQKSGGTLLPIFIWESDLIRGPRSSTNRTWFLRESLAELTGELAARGSTLLELQGPATTAFPALVTELRAAGIGTGSIDAFITRDHTPYALARDRAVADALIPLNVSLHATRGLVVVEPDELLTGGGTAYGVYTPYFRRWIDLVVQRAERPYLLQRDCLHHHLTHSPACFAWIAKHSQPLRFLPRNVTSSQPLANALHVQRQSAGSARARATVRADTRTAATRSLMRRGPVASQQLCTLDFSSRELVARMLPLPPERAGERSGERTWVSQIAWRDFYTQVLWHAPHAARGAWRPAYDAVQWDDRQEPFDAWREGRTGYPIVDAAMRQLRSSGFMHNRARMISASFLTKDLLVDWRKGEAHFLQHLVDGDVAANNGGWQWSAGSGTDAQPYFRIFNPVTQAGNFDPDGAYIRRWVPELAALKTPAIHAPWAHATALAAAGITLGVQYPAPIVDHADARVRTLAAYARATRAK